MTITESVRELEMFQFFELTPDLVFIAGKDGYFRNVNQAVIDTLGYSREELMALPINHFVHLDDIDLTNSKRSELHSGKALINFDNRYITKSGREVWLHWTSIYVPDKQVVFAIAKNITDRKEAEKEIEAKYKKFEHLASHFKSRLEKDRKYLATELQEELGQLASVAKMEISSLRDNVPSIDESGRSRIDHALGVMDILIKSIRRISYSLSPNMLDDVGLNETLQWLCDEFTQLNGIPCFYTGNYMADMLPHEVQLDLFRICQEAMTNIMDHSGAQSASISFETTSKEIILTIADNGRGFHLRKLKHTPGLDNMRKQAALVKGKLIIDTAVGKGTRIMLNIDKQNVI